ncbi:hypothetical protein D3250_08300 [Nesterenkonia natronophila]|uniref:Trm112 family protein n=2 Tax=Nesterenkonia natronophila TaxID=2174932 RepID=A0A3A4FIC3_9MICC|nr:hypothetical protein D3250_08300 [Nesterenkonia natronophila]
MRSVRAGTLETMPRTSLIEPLIMQLLRCPVTGSPLRQEGQELVAVGDTNRRYPIDQGVPTLLKDHNS